MDDEECIHKHISKIIWGWKYVNEKKKNNCINAQIKDIIIICGYGRKFMQNKTSQGFNSLLRIHLISKDLNIFPFNATPPK